MKGFRAFNATTAERAAFASPRPTSAGENDEVGFQPGFVAKAVVGNDD